ncbi:unnamed protein product [Mytilus edulis]|uniref:MULE transposase domain-containing protein n=1 Tax=Mytilus edulis TaxID=6550 RepID=A0A8S3TZ44_MYTED|nr:unnamed protein product [Mytilus edulis]
MCLGDCNDTYKDATFKSVPRPYMQFLTIHGFYRDRVKPFVYALITDKHIGSYRQITRHIKRCYRRLTDNDLSPQNIVSDFETGMITAAETEIPQARMCGCFFHFCRSIWRRLQKEGLRNAFNRRLALRRLCEKNDGHSVSSIGGGSTKFPVVSSRCNYSMTMSQLSRFKGAINLFPTKLPKWTV